MKLHCPLCTQHLEKITLSTKGSYWRCFNHGAWLSIKFLQQFKQTHHFIQRLLNATYVRPDQSNKAVPCPSCRKNMSLLKFNENATSHLIFDVCPTCQHIWFDIGELERVREKGELDQVFSQDELSPQIFKAPTSTKLKWPSSQPDSIAFNASDKNTMHPLNFLGLPTESEVMVKPRTAALTYLLIFFCFGMTFKGLHNPDFLMNWVYVPQAPLRDYGLTLITALFLHAGWWHFFSNAYFLFMAGDNVESELSSTDYFLLFFGGGVTGHLLSTFMHLPKPTVGASGAVMGLLVYYAMSFPHNRFQMVWRVPYRWTFFSYTASAPLVVVYYVLLDIGGAFLLSSGRGHVNHYAHLGGAAFAFLFYGWQKINR